MQQNESDVVILIPTPAFLSFLADQLPDAELPDIHFLKTNRTAYTISKKDSDEETLDEIERHFPSMFQHEIERILGVGACKGIECSFLDFLMSFKFELHSQIVLMEPSIEQGHQLLCIKPRSVLIKWIKSSLSESQFDLVHVLKPINLSHIVENATVLVKNFNHLSDVKPFIEHYYRAIFKAEMLRICGDSEQWPAIDSFQMFRRYFAVEIHTHLIHLDKNSPTLVNAPYRSSSYAFGA